MNSAAIHRTSIESPLGPLLAGASENGIVGLYFEGVHCRQPRDTSDWVECPERFETLKRQLDEYFSGSRKSFDLPLDWELRGTPFYKSVWSELVKVPYGETVSYREIARRIGNPKAIRAVGMANARNPVSIVVPCHRVVASNGKLTGYAGGIAIKEELLKREGHAIQGELALH